MLSLFSEFASLEDVHQSCLDCTRCGLSGGRRSVVFGAGKPDARLMLVGQGPSLTDDQTGVPYSGPASEFLDKALEQAGLSREEIWVTNLHKCVATKVDGKTGKVSQRPPKADEVGACRVWLEEELFWIKPTVLVAIGGPAAQVLLGREFQLTAQRGLWLDSLYGIPALATYQPTYLKRLSQWDRPAAVQGWRDLVADLHAARERSL